MMAACGRGPAPALSNKADTAAIAAFQHRLDSLKLLENDTLKSAGVRALYSEARPDVREAAVPAILKVLRSVLLTDINADDSLLPFYKSLCSDGALSYKSHARVDIQLASYYAHIEHNADSAAAYLILANRHPEALNDSLKGSWYACNAQVQQLRGDPKAATESLYRGIAFYEKTGEHSRIAGCYGNLANVYRSMNDLHKAIEARRKALDYFTVKKDDADRVVAIGGLAADFTDLMMTDSARKYFSMSEGLFRQGVQAPVAEYYLYLSKGGLYVTLKRYDSAALYFDKAKTILPLFHDPAQEMLFTVTSTIGYAHQRNVAQEVKAIEGYIPKMLSVGNLNDARDAAYSLFNIALTQKTGRDALDCYQQYDSLKTVLADSGNRKFIAELETRYETEKKNLQIRVQRNELSQQRTLNVALGLSVFAAVLLGSFFVARVQLLRSRREAKLQQQFTSGLLKNTEEERGRIAGELHDGISHELLSLKNNLHQSTGSLEQKIDAIINDIRMLSRNLHPVMLDKIGLTHSVQHLCEQVMSAGHLFVSADIDYRNQLSEAGELQLYRIIQESLTNAVKYAEAHAAKVSISSAERRLTVSIQDNGCGFDVEDKLGSKTAFGLHSITERSRALGGRATITSGSQGTVIQLEIPLSNANPYHS